MPDGVALRPSIRGASTFTPPIPDQCSFRDLKGKVVHLSADVPAGYPSSKGFVGTRKRSLSEQFQQCAMYAYSVDRSRVQRFSYGHFARLEGKTMDGDGSVFSWVNGLPDTQGGTGPYVMYTTLAYLESIGFRPVN